MVMHTGKGNDGYALTNMGYDYLVLKVFMKRGIVKQVGLKIGMGKESDIYVCSTDDPERPTVIIKFARLGRASFRTVKTNRDYIKKGQGCHSWLYLSRLASLKEFAFMKALYDRGFPTPVPIDCNRHGICMSLVNAYPMVQVSVIPDPKKVYERLMELIIKLAEHGLVHGDFNEFNLMISDDHEITMIDFP
jgi:RIO kinase 2